MGKHQTRQTKKNKKTRVNFQKPYIKHNTQRLLE